MLFSQKVQKRIELLQQDYVEISDKQFILTEKNEEGVAELCIETHYPGVLFRNLEKKKLEYFKNNKCADYILFENRGKSWILHVFELKRTVTDSKWEEVIKNQFRGAMQNALAIAGFMGISIKPSQIRLYTAYRIDRIDNEANPVKLRLSLQEKNLKGKISKTSDWDKEKVQIDYLDCTCLRHTRIALEPESGKGKIIIL